MNKLFFALSLFTFACSGTSTGSERADLLIPSPGGGYPGHLQYVFCDVKRPLDGDDTPLLPASFDSVLGGFAMLGCNGVRVYIDPTLASYADYPAAYKTFLGKARDLGFVVYANPLGTGSFGKSDSDYASWVVKYANGAMPHYLGPFNEPGNVINEVPGLGDSDLDAIARQVRKGLTYWNPQLVGPDEMKVAWSIDHELPGLLGSLDIVGSHDVYDDDATTSAWNFLASKTGSRPAWASECPRDWNEKNPTTKREIGIQAIVDANIEALVIYEAFPRRVNADGTLTDAAAQTIANHL